MQLLIHEALYPEDMETEMPPIKEEPVFPDETKGPDPDYVPPKKKRKKPPPRPTHSMVLRSYQFQFVPMMSKAKVTKKKGKRKTIRTYDLKLRLRDYRSNTVMGRFLKLVNLGHLNLDRAEARRRAKVIIEWLISEQWEYMRASVPAPLLQATAQHTAGEWEKYLGARELYLTKNRLHKGTYPLGDDKTPFTGYFYTPPEAEAEEEAEAEVEAEAEAAEGEVSVSDNDADDADACDADDSTKQSVDKVDVVDGVNAQEEEEIEVDFDDVDVAATDSIDDVAIKEEEISDDNINDDEVVDGVMDADAAATTENFDHVRQDSEAAVASEEKNVFDNAGLDGVGGEKAAAAVGDKHPIADDGDNDNGNDNDGNIERATEIVGVDAAVEEVLFSDDSGYDVGGLTSGDDGGELIDPDESGIDEEEKPERIFSNDTDNDADDTSDDDGYGNLGKDSDDTTITLKRMKNHTGLYAAEENLPDPGENVDEEGFDTWMDYTFRTPPTAYQFGDPSNPIFQDRFFCKLPKKTPHAFERFIQLALVEAATAAGLKLARQCDLHDCKCMLHIPKGGEIDQKAYEGCGWANNAHAGLDDYIRMLDPAKRKATLKCKRKERRERRKKLQDELDRLKNIGPSKVKANEDDRTIIS